MRFIDSFHFLTAARLLGCAETHAESIIRPAGLAILFAAVLAGQPPLSITSNSLPTGIVGTLYAVQLAASGGAPPYVWTLSGGTLPAGISLNSSTGTLVGTPSSGGNYPITISVADSLSSIASKQFTLQIGGGANPAVTTTSPLPAATAGVSYSVTLTATGGLPPYTWSLGPGLAQGLALNASSGVISGTPVTAGTYSFSVQVTDSKSVSASSPLTLTVNPAALQITNPVGLFNGTVGSAYTPTTFSAQGGTPPYVWSILSGNADGLTIDAATGVLSGTPQAAGTFSFVVQVKDNAGRNVSQNFSFVVNNPSLIITASSFPPGAVGVAYSQSSPVAVASGGTPPYTWSLINGSVPGLTFIPANVAFSGIPSQPGTFPITLQVADANGLNAAKSFTVTIAPAGLSITTSRQLSSATFNVAYSQAVAAAGGTPPYTWSANGLPKGLSINPTTGLISGVPTAAGTFSFVVLTVVDSTLKSASDNFSLIVSLPAAPPITISGLPAAVAPATQLPLQVTLGGPYSTDLTGQVIIGFQANSGLGDATILFSTGGKTANFSIPAGSTAATFLDANGIAVPQLQIQTGTVAGSISISLANVNAAGVDITPNPAPSISTQIAAAAPVITNVLVTRNGTGGCPSGQLCIQVTGFSTAREVTQAVYTFTAASGQTLQPAAGSITVDVSKVFTTWFASSTIGSQFILSQPFTVQGDPAAVIPMTVALTNRVGTTTSNIGQ